MKKRLFALGLVLVLVLGLSACAGKTDSKTIKVGATPAPHAEILEVTKDLLAEKGYTLEVVEFDDLHHAQHRCGRWELDANYFQHITYMNTFNTDNGTHLVSAGAIHYEPFGLYAGKTASLDALPTARRSPSPTTPPTAAAPCCSSRSRVSSPWPRIPAWSPRCRISWTTPRTSRSRSWRPGCCPTTLQDVDMAVINGKLCH